MKKVELLAPAGDMEVLKAAIEAGCDAVYLAGKMYGARAFAGNFSNDELINAINYAHLYGVKVYVTVNTIVYEDEVDNFINYIKFIHKNNVDAILIQDLGMFDLIRKKFPNLEIHASTQMHIHNKEGALLAKKLGIKRIVIARETPIDVIKKIKEEVDIEIECFIHGALCVSYSGQCYMSALIGNRSANRGTCAQCCRRKYDLYDENNNKLNHDKYLLSTKDLLTLDNIDKIILSGVDSLKIEGRLKSKEYVYEVVSIYRKVIDNYYLKNKTLQLKENIITLKKLFNRSFTKGFILNENNNNFTYEKRPNHQGIVIGKVISKIKNILKIKLDSDVHINDGLRILDDKEDKGLIIQSMYINNKKVLEAKKNDVIELKYNDYVKVGATVLKTTDNLLEVRINDEINKKSRKVLINVYVEAYENKKFLLKITDGINEVSSTSSNCLSKAITSPTSKDIIIRQISKIKDTVYKINNIVINMNNSVFIDLKCINEVRRNAICMLNEKRLYKIDYIEKEYSINIDDFPNERVKTAFVMDKKTLINNIDKYDYLYVEDNKLLMNDKCILKIPRVNNIYKEHNEKVLIGEFGSLYNYEKFITDFSFNVTNSYAVAFLHSMGALKVTLSYELNTYQIKRIIEEYIKRYNKNPNLEVILNGNKEAMICKYSLNKKYDKKLLYLKDEYNSKYLLKDYGEYMIIYDNKKNSIDKEEYYNIGINSIRDNL